MTIQPFKNDQAVVPMVVNNTKTSPTVSEVVHLQSPLLQKSAPSLAKPSGDERENVVLSGAATSPGKETASQLLAIRNDTEVRTQKATLVNAVVTVERHMAEMQQVMNHITKSFPPFAPGDEKRQEYLMSISSIREQILKMIVPPPPPAVPPSGMWRDLFQGITLPRLPVAGPNEASDAQIQTAYAEVAVARTTLAQRRATLVQQTIPSTSLTSGAAVQSSIQAGQQLTTTGGTLSVQLVGELQNL